MFVDIHVHMGSFSILKDESEDILWPETLMRKYDGEGIEWGIIQPMVNPEFAPCPQSMRTILEVCEAFPERFRTFCNIDPRALRNTQKADFSPLLEYYKGAGCIGLGEICANLPIDDPRVLNLFSHCERFGLPVLFHLTAALGDSYGLYDQSGLPGLEEALRSFPDLIFIGHAQAFWSEIGPLDKNHKRGGYPKGPISRPGRVVELMRRYPNLHGDLSGLSGLNAISRDNAFGSTFLDEFNDRLYFGTDFLSPQSESKLAAYLRDLRDSGAITAEGFKRIAADNARRLAGLF
ncbi:MAG: amidohydrolase family protein [Chitinivibrionales bacterium]|nr:amidohydrolase family protein [Chitinivibrionales bacterium]MBD3358714.1 amidohydrolase family protein [Chitinivibrionales bacterium]